MQNQADAVYTVMEQAQPPGPQPPQPPPAPATALVSPLDVLENAAKTDISRVDPASHWGHGASSSMLLMGLRRSKRWAQDTQRYS